MARTVAIPVLVTAAVIGLAAVLNPTAEQHRDKIKAAIAERSQIERLLGIGHLTAFVSNYHSLGLASYTTVGDKTASVGAFGIVFVLD